MNWNLTRPRFFRRREIWVPTLFSSVLLCLVSVVLVYAAVRNLHGFLAKNQPAPDAALLIVEGWLLPAELDQAAQAFRSGRYQRVLTTGGPIENHFDPSAYSTFAERAQSYLVRRGIPRDLVEAVPAPASVSDRTFQSALKVRDWLTSRQPDVRALDIFSCGAHSRRSRLLYELALRPRRIGVLAAQPTDYAAASWWRSSAGAKAVLSETIAWLWTALFFNPARD